ncbi:MAG TPA: LysM peptidoglycan-binding domain-containing protein [Candidatus Sulfomarinibacteraceae bacterium]|nr:LysM peptidoglycan-binding domain-containing protein [Candidatus Sulfomarinibacteraceae bacterium]
MTQDEELGRAGGTQAESRSSSDPPEAVACPYVLAAGGAWRSRTPSREHRCAAVAPAAPLAIQKQARLCLAPAHTTCATFQAVIAARRERGLAPRPSTSARSTFALQAGARWGIVRTTPVVDVGTGARAWASDLIAARRGWQAIPALVLVFALAAIGVAGLGQDPEATGPSPAGQANLIATPATTPAPTGVATPAPAATTQPSEAPSTPTPAPTPTLAAAPTAASTPQPTPTTAPSARTTYTVRSGDTLYGIARSFGTTVSAIKALNGLTSNTIHVGLVLQIP